MGRRTAVNRLASPCGGRGTPGRGPRGAPDKVRPRPGVDIGQRWHTELRLLGYHDPDRPVDLAPAPIGALDRQVAVERVLARLAAARSAWNAADLRGEVEQLIAAAGIVTEPAVRIELAEDLTARAIDRCWRGTACPSTSAHGPRRRWSTPRPS